MPLKAQGLLFQFPLPLVRAALGVAILEDSVIDAELGL